MNSSVSHPTEKFQKKLFKWCRTGGWVVWVGSQDPPPSPSGRGLTIFKEKETK
jgi:hypothetical protein